MNLFKIEINKNQVIVRLNKIKKIQKNKNNIQQL